MAVVAPQSGHGNADGRDSLQGTLMIAGEGVFDTIPIEADYTVGDMKLWIKYHKNIEPSTYDLVGPKGKWKMGAVSSRLRDRTSPHFSHASPRLASPPLFASHRLSS